MDLSILDTALGVLKGDHGLLPQIIGIFTGGAAAPSAILLALNILRIPVIRQAFIGTAKVGGFISAKTEFPVRTPGREDRGRRARS